VGDALAREILSGRVNDGDTVCVDERNDALVVEGVVAAD
jgi:hypothetical protein